MKYVFYDTAHNQYIGEGKGIKKAIDIFEDTLNALDIKDIRCDIFEDDADIEHDQPDQAITGEQFRNRAKVLGALPVKSETNRFLGALPVKSETKTESTGDIKPVSQDRAGILKNLSIEEQAYVIGRVADQMLLDELDRRMNSYNSTLDKILGNIKGLEVRI